MRKRIATILLYAFTCSLIPWSMLCLAHPFGHDHHAHDGPSICELHRIAAQTAGEHLLPPMDCEHLANYTDDFALFSSDKVLANTINLVQEIFPVQEIKTFHFIRDDFSQPPDSHIYTIWIYSDSPLRAPPIV